MDIPQEVLNSLPEEIQSMLSGEKITKEQYELFLELIEKRKNEEDIHIYKKKVHTYCMRLNNFKVCDKNKKQKTSS